MKAIFAPVIAIAMLFTLSPLSAQEPSATETEQADVMNLPLDGSSIESFDAGLEKVRDAHGEATYQEVRAAVDYLLFYDLAARQDRATLYTRLDGMTPREVMQRAKAR